MRVLLPVLCLFLALAPLRSPASAQGSAGRKVHPAVADQAAWYDPTKERPDLVPGAFEVLRFPVPYAQEDRYERDPKDPKRILNPDFYCSTCAAEGRIADTYDHQGHRIAEKDEAVVLQWVRERLRRRESTFFEDAYFKIFIDVGRIDLQDKNHRIRHEELVELKAVFPELDLKRLRFLPHHPRAHLYLNRARRLLRDFWWLAGMSNEEMLKKWPHLGPCLGMRNKLEVLAFTRRDDYEEFSDRYLGRVIRDGQPWHNMRDNSLLTAMHVDDQPDMSPHGTFLHRISHNVLDSYRRYGFKMPAWLQLGLAHWVQRREDQRWNTFCTGEGTAPEKFPPPRWLPLIRRLVVQDEALPFVAATDRTEYDEFTLDDHMMTWSWFCYLLRLGPEKLRIYLNILKDGPADEPIAGVQRRAFREAYGLSFQDFDAGWRRWVRDIYPPD